MSGASLVVCRLLNLGCWYLIDTILVYWFIIYISGIQAIFNPSREATSTARNETAQLPRSIETLSKESTTHDARIEKTYIWKLSQKKPFQS